MVGRPCAHWKGSLHSARAQRTAWLSARERTSPNITAERHAFDASKRVTAGGGCVEPPALSSSTCRYSTAPAQLSPTPCTVGTE
eukprot:scaffold11885_cov129-Isochrysis_galbana.AAC.11